jgi:hypothetical protein
VLDGRAIDLAVALRRMRIAQRRTGRHGGRPEARDSFRPPAS